MPSMKGNGLKEKDMDKGNKYFKMEIFMKVNGMKVNNKEMDA